MDKIAIGKSGEHQAMDYLIDKGFEILEQNYRFGKGEIDIIAMKDALIIFVEVKKRKNDDFGHPEDFVSDNQKKMILDTSNVYIHSINWQKNVRYDIIAITGKELLHLEDAFY